MTALINAVMCLIQREFAIEEPTWQKIALPVADFSFLQKECNTQSEFDPHNVRKGLLDKLRDNSVFMTTMHCKYGQVCAILDQQQMKEMPWGLWGRILRLYSERTKQTEQTETPFKPFKPFKIFFLANKHLRQFPESLLPIQSIHINGGYTYSCNHETIVIYRAEDATRVLIHELQHSCCLDKRIHSTDIIEANTEAWAELLYVGFVSQGKLRLFRKLLQIQSDWICCQNEIVRKHINVETPMQFPWRYTIGKEEIWKKWNILRPMSYVKCNSMRLTFQPSDLIKKQFGVLDTSVIL